MTPHSAPGRGPADPDRLVLLGVIRRPHGVRGEASVEMLTDDPSRLSELDSVFLVSPRRDEILPAKIIGCRVHKGRALALFDLFKTPEAVAEHRDWTVEIPEDESRELEADEYFIHDLIGLEVRDAAGRSIGRVSEALESSVQLLLRVERVSGGSFEMPFAEALVRSIDLEAKLLVVELPAGLETLNDPEPPKPKQRKRDGT
ncbi:MAG: ribosome maturation factor RimM [Thermoanaerobaculia bacterium]